MRLRPLPLPATVLAALVIGAGPADAQTARHASSQANVAQSQDEQATGWSFATWAYMYFVPDSSDYLQPSASADRGWLHVEARLNYEELEAGSVWIGYNFGGGDHVAWSFTPMLGGVFGSREAVAPGYEGSLRWRRLDVYSEGEFVIDPGDSTENFLYSWTEATVDLTRGLRVGGVTQRTRAYDAERDIQRGLSVGFTRGAVDVSGYVFNPDDSSPIFMVAVRIDF